MKITKSKLKQIIKEEITRVINEETRFTKYSREGGSALGAALEKVFSALDDQTKGHYNPAQIDQITDDPEEGINYAVDAWEKKMYKDQYNILISLIRKHPEHPEKEQWKHHLAAADQQLIESSKWWETEGTVGTAVGVSLLGIAVGELTAKLGAWAVKKGAPATAKRLAQFGQRIASSKAAQSGAVKGTAKFAGRLVTRLAAWPVLIVDVAAIYVDAFSPEAKRAENYRPMWEADMIKYHVTQWNARSMMDREFAKSILPKINAAAKARGLAEVSLNEFNWDKKDNHQEAMQAQLDAFPEGFSVQGNNMKIAGHGMVEVGDDLAWAAKRDYEDLRRRLKK